MIWKKIKDKIDERFDDKKSFLWFLLIVFISAIVSYWAKNYLNEKFNKPSPQRDGILYAD